MTANMQVGHFVIFLLQNACGAFADIFSRAVGNMV
jgi:hypothetical protein